MENDGSGDFKAGYVAQIKLKFRIYAKNVAHFLKTLHFCATPLSIAGEEGIKLYPKKVLTGQNSCIIVLIG